MRLIDEIITGEGLEALDQNQSGSPRRKSNKTYIKTLQRRADFLKKKIDEHPNYTDISYTRGEYAALVWAIRRLEIEVQNEPKINK